MLSDNLLSEQEHLQVLVRSLEIKHIQQEKDCLYLECEGLSIRWERHTEFSSYSFLIPAEHREPFSYMAINSICQNWLDKLPGTIINAINV